MWLVYAVAGMFFMALVNYLDEYLTHSSASKSDLSFHKRIGGLLVISTLLCSFGTVVLFFLTDVLTIDNQALIFALLSSFFMVSVWAGYFYLFQIYSAHQVVPLFGLSSIWLLGFELLSGSSISLLPLIGVGILILGAYLLDNGSLKWKIPSSLLLWMSLVSFSWAMTVYLVKVASETSPAVTVYFWQSFGIVLVGILLFVFVKPYRVGFVQRVKVEGKNFVLPSFVNESFAQVSFLLNTIAISLAPLAVYVTAAGGVQSLMLLIIFALFPLEERNRVTSAQWIAVVLIATGIYLLEA